MAQDEQPNYLMTPEVLALLHYVPDLHRKMLMATLWNPGARINEALVLTRSDFSRVPPYPPPPETASGKSGKNSRKSTSR